MSYICIVCDNPIPDERATKALLSGELPRYDTDRCARKGKRERHYKRKYGGVTTTEDYRE